MTAPAAPKIDLWSSASFNGGHPREQYRWLRRHDPVHWHKEPGGRGFWAITKHEDVRAISRDSQTFSNSPTIMMQDVAPGSRPPRSPGSVGAAVDLGQRRYTLEHPRGRMV